MEWISVEDDLPDMGVPVFTAGSHYEPITGYRANHHRLPRWHCYITDEWITGVTHWAKIEPPKDNV